MKSTDLPEWADGPQDVILFRKELIHIVHNVLIAHDFLLFGLENLEYNDILDYISLLPEEAVDEIIRQFSETGVDYRAPKNS